ncbi:MAG TPA: hypothetical protein VJT09_00635 [Pyrinomonadaceae bacterium]|nr:hypothetical protein [Pyrinomonadaceae bacterium]
MRIHLRRKGAKLLPLGLLVYAGLFALACGTKQQVETYQKAENRANEAGAISALQNIYRAQTQYSLTHSGSYGTFDELVAEGSLDRRFSGNAPVLEGYVFTMTRVGEPGSSSGSSFTANADPQSGTSPGARHLYVDASSNVVRANATQRATASDPPLQ